ncbi:MAG: hypothetical protein PVTTEEND_000820 [Candidatus Fervidibacter sp.]
MRQDRKRRKGQTKERLCLGCRRLFPKAQLLRVGALKEGRVVVDERQTLGGRGAYVCPTMDCLIAAFKRRGWGQALRRPVPEPVALMRQLSPCALWLTGDPKRLA